MIWELALPKFSLTLQPVGRTCGEPNEMVYSERRHRMAKVPYAM